MKNVKAIQNNAILIFNGDSQSDTRLDRGVFE